MWSKNISNVSKTFNRHLHISKECNNKLKYVLKRKFEKVQDPLEELIARQREKIIYNTIVASQTPSYPQMKYLEKQDEILQESIRSTQPLPVFLKYLSTSDNKQPNKQIDEPTQNQEPQVIHFPFGNEGNISINKPHRLNTDENEVKSVADEADEEIRKRQEFYKKINHDWMKDYENYEESDELIPVDEWKINYGTPNVLSEISNVPCGGCGALLHCKDTSIPGYIPSEIYQNSFKKEGVHLQAIVCQRCHFLKNYNLALQVRVSPEDYPKVLETLNLKGKKALVILMVDLLDFPCSIWPGLVDVLGTQKPIVIVGNKVDLIPRDCSRYLDNIKNNLKNVFKERMSSSSSLNIKDIRLISAKTGYGVEELITKLHNIWENRGDVYLVGCTNVGKSTLFNCLLQSDFCKIQAVDLVQRATTSVWPGTTLNLLKFPILRPSGWRLYARTQRLKAAQKLRAKEEYLNKSDGNSKFTSLMDMVDRTFMPEPSGDHNDVSLNSMETKGASIGINEKAFPYIHSKWCYDTPGVVQPDQIIHLLTTEELILTLPKQMIKPQTFGIRLNQTIFIAGIGRLDYLEGPNSILITVFRSEGLPLTMCYTEQADNLYKELLGTDLFQVPKGSKERLNMWPNLKSSMTITMSGSEYAPVMTDVVLSNAGWISIKADRGCELKFKAWTPEARGIYVRKSLLPFAVNYRGSKLKKSPAFKCDQTFKPK